MSARYDAIGSGQAKPAVAVRLANGGLHTALIDLRGQVL
jgi:hypothetical protein